MREVVVRRQQGKTALITMQDRENGNMFTDDLVDQLKSHLAAACDDPNTHVIVLAGDGPYFSCGGTKEDLLRILEGKIQFVHKGIHDLLPQVALPVITAVQGHAMGGGLALACSGDLAVFGRENVYSASFMKYGFSPGMGSTVYLPRTLGETLAADMLYTSHAYRGQDFIDRHAPVVVVPKADVVAAALAKAAEFGDKERGALMLLKAHLTRDLRARLPEAIAGELAMHDQTFFQKESIRARILERFGGT